MNKSNINIKKSKNKKTLREYMWIISASYLTLGFFNILFGWLGLICFFIPLFISIFSGTKSYCNKYCGRGQLLQLLGDKFKLSRYRDIPMWMKTKKFRYGFLTFFMAMFINMIFVTWLVFAGSKNLSQTVTLLWTFDLPWHWAYTGNVPEGVAQFAFGFYSIMITSTLLGIITGILYKPRSWCVYCPMGTMTQGICVLKHGKEG